MKEKRESFPSFTGGERPEWWRNISLEKLFNFQFHRLGWYGSYRPATRETFEPLVALGKMIPEVKRMIPEIRDTPQGHIPFLLVNRDIPIVKQISLLFDRKWPVKFKLDPRELKHPYDSEIPRGWYLIVDVEVGRELEHIPLRNAGMRLRRAGRYPLDLYEGVALALIMTEEVAGRVVSLPGSRYRKDDIPYVAVVKDPETSVLRLRIGSSRPRIFHKRWGIASSARRIILPREF